MDARIDLQRTIYDIANKTGIPPEHVVDAWELINLNPDVPAKDLKRDKTHPNERGHGIIAQDIFMRMSFSKMFLE